MSKVAIMIVVTGGAGFIGSNIVKALNKKGITNILVVDNLKNGTKVLNLKNLNIVDYMDKEDFSIQIEKKELVDIDAIFHEGACTSTTELDGKYMMENNYQYSKKILLYCIEREISFLYASSASVYGNKTSSFIESREYEDPLNVYGYSKFLFDEYVRKILPKVKSQVVGFRYFNVYGPHEGHKNKMASVAFHLNTQLRKGRTLTLFKGSKNIKRDFIYVSDVVDVNLWFLENGISGIFNLGTGFAESFQKVAESVIGFYKRGSIKYIPLPKKLKCYYQKFTKANLTKLRATGYKKPFKTLAEGLKEYMVWLSNDISLK